MRRINSVECPQMRQSVLRTTPLESNYLHLAIDLNIFTLYESEAKAKGLLQQVGRRDLLLRCAGRLGHVAGRARLLLHRDAL